MIGTDTMDYVLLLDICTNFARECQAEAIRDVTQVRAYERAVGKKLKLLEAKAMEQRRERKAVHKAD